MRFHLLTLLRDAWVPVPEPYYVDTSGQLLGAPCVVVGFVAGEPPREGMDPQELALAQVLALIHVTGIPNGNGQLGRPLPHRFHQPASAGPACATHA